MQIRPGIELANLSDVGRAREVNEDYFGYVEPDDDEAFAQKGRLVIIADGMGGYEGGQLASRLAVETIRDTYMAAPPADPAATLLESFHIAHRKIRQFASEHAEVEQMGTTCTAAVLIGSQLYFVNIGDSRLYLLRGTELRQLTQDDSYVNRMIREGMLSREEAEHHPNRNVLTAALGSKTEEADPKASQAPEELTPGDTLLLCTDGLHGLVSDEEMLSLVNGRSPSEACQELVALANAHGGPDNITVQIVRYVGAGLRQTRVTG
jgi:serine/threonine protein phosphatase PrpC